MSGEVAWLKASRFPNPRRGVASAAVLRRVTAVLDLDSLGDEALAAFLTTAANDVAAGFGGHAGPEAKLIFPGSLGWLIGAFAHGVGLK
jgi:hypothetical protein